MYLYLARNEVRHLFPSAEQTLRDILSTGLREFDVYRITEDLTPATMREIEKEHHKVSEKFRAQYLKFIKEFLKLASRKDSNVETSILKLLKAVNSKNIQGVRKFVGQRDSALPRVAVRTLFGYNDEEGVQLDIEASEQVEVIETDRMNPIELACVRGHAEILKYFVDELNLISKQEFSSQNDSEERSLESMHFIFVPIIQKHAAVFEILMNIPTLWSFEELKQIATFLKQAKWREGFLIFFKSASVK